MNETRRRRSRAGGRKSRLAARARPIRSAIPYVTRRIPVYEVLSPYGKLDDGVKTQPRADSAVWLAEWRTLAYLTNGIRADDLRFQPVMVTLEQCDMAFLSNDWLAFRQAAQQVREAVECGRRER